MKMTQEPAVVTWLARFAWLVMLLIGVGSFAGSFPAWLDELDAGHPGCTFEEVEAGLRVTGASWAGSPCDVLELEDSVLTAIDGVSLRGLAPSAVDALLRQKPSSVHQWSLEAVAGGQERQLSVPYEQGPLAHALEESGDSRADLIVAGVAILGALARTGVFFVAAIMLVRVGWRSTVKLLLSGALFAFSLGLGFVSASSPAWVGPLQDAAALCTVAGLGVLVATLPRGVLRPGIPAVIAVAWFFGTALLLNPMNLALPIPPGAAVWAQLGFAGAALLTLVGRYKSASTHEKHQLGWIIGGVGLGFFAAIPLVFPVLPPAATEFHLDLLFPMVLCITPLALLAAFDNSQSYDLPNIVRITTLVSVLMGTAALVVLVVAEVVPWVLRRVHASPDTLLPPWVEPTLVIVAGLVLTGLMARWIVWLTDIAFFPTRGVAKTAITQAISALEDCADLAEIEWCVTRALLHGFDARGPVVYRRAQRQFLSLIGDTPMDLALTPQELSELDAGRLVTTAPDSEGLYTVVLPLHHRGDLQGLLIAPPAEATGYTPTERTHLEALAPALAGAVWRATRPLAMGIVAPLRDDNTLTPIIGDVR